MKNRFLGLMGLLLLIFSTKNAFAVIVPTNGCGWCGLSCTRLSSNMACVMIAPPEGKACNEVNGVCTIQNTTQCVTRPKCLDVVPSCLIPEPVQGWCTTGAVQTPTPPTGCFYKQVQCAVAPCNPILVCPTPTAGVKCVPEPACFSGIKDPVTGTLVYCDPKPGVVYCPKVTPTTTSCTPRLPCMDGITGSNGQTVVCAADLLPGQPPYCPKNTATPTVTGQLVTAAISCGSSGSQAVIKVDSRIVDVWIVVENTVTGEKVINSYSKNDGAIVFGPNINSGLLSNMRSGTGYVNNLKITTDTIYKVSVYTSPYSIFIPTDWKLVGTVNVTLPKCTTTSGIPGDANGDGKVDLADFVIWKSDYLFFIDHVPEGDLATDFNRDGKIDLVDFAVWKTAYLKVSSKL